MKLWNMTISVPLNYRADSLQVAGYIDATRVSGWYENQPHLGAPFGQVYHDFPFADNLHLAIIGLMLLVVSKFGIAMNLYYLIGFPLAALTATWFFRSIGISRVITTTLAILFALAPYHFFRNEGHYFLAAYWPIPLFGVLLVKVLLGKGLWERRPGGWRRLGGFATWRNAGTLLILVICGSATQYYAVFELILLPIAALMTFARVRNWRLLLGYIVAWAVIAVVLVLNMLPDFIYAYQHGPNYVAAYRPAIHAEWFSLKIIMLLLPIFGHRFGPFADLADSYRTQFDVYTMPSLGIIGSIGFIAILVVITRALTLMPSRRRADGPSQPIRISLLNGFSSMTLWILLVGSMGGLAVFISLLVTTKIRGWDRLSIYITLMSLAAVGILIQLAWRRVRRSRVLRNNPRGAVARLALPAVALVILGIGLWDQTAPSLVPNYSEVKTNFDEDDSYVAAITHKVTDPTSMIFQLPYQPFPEGPYLVNNMIDYDHIRLSLHSDSLRWSYGGVKGRPETDWPSLLTNLSTAEMVKRVAATDFAGISIDRQGYADNGKKIEADLNSTLRIKPVVSSKGTYSFWDLSKYRAALLASDGKPSVDTLAYTTLHPVIAYGKDPGLVLLSQTASGQTWKSLGGTSTLMFATNSSRSVKVHVSFFIGAVDSLKTMSMTLPDGSTRKLNVASTGIPVSLDFSVKPGQNFFTLNGVEAKTDNHYRIENLAIFRQ